VINTQYSNSILKTHLTDLLWWAEISANWQGMYGLWLFMSARPLSKITNKIWQKLKMLI